MEAYEFNHEQFGQIVAIPQQINHDSPYVPVNLFQFGPGQYTSRGTVWILPHRLGNPVSISFAGLQYASADMFGVEIHKQAPVTFPVAIEDEERGEVRDLKADEYNVEELKLFIRAWKKTDRFIEVARYLGIKENQVLAIFNRLKREGISLPRKDDQPAPKKSKGKFSWKMFVRAIKGAKYVETAMKMTGYSMEKLLFLCSYLQDNEVPVVIPPFENPPQWIKIRSANGMKKQKIVISNKHGSGRQFKKHWAGYHKSAFKLPALGKLGKR